MIEVKDALGNTLYEGDFVAHISRHSSSLIIVEREVIAFREVPGGWHNGTHKEVKFRQTGRWARAYNVVRVGR